MNALALLLLAGPLGCGTTDDTVYTAGPNNPPSALSVSGRVAGAGAGATVTAYHVQPNGTVGEGYQIATTYPLPPPTSFAQTRTDAQGNFSFPVQDGRPVYVQSGQYRAVLEGPGTTVLTPQSTYAATLAQAQMRGGQAVAEAIRGSNAAIARHFVGTAAKGEVEAATLEQDAQRLGYDVSSFFSALDRDIRDGTFDGLDNGEKVPVRTTTGTLTDVNPASAAGNVSTVSTYRSPYSVTYTVSGLTTDFSQTPRNEIAQESFEPVFSQWYDRSAYAPGQVPWGPDQSRRYPAPAIPDGVNRQEWMRQRIIATATKYIGYQYQHHHIPDWFPSADPTWPWNPVAAGSNSKGMDCSNFSGWNYNYGLGILLNTDVKVQSEQTQVFDANGTPIQIQKLLQARGTEVVDYETILNTLQTGDMLYIRSDQQQISHVITWVGRIGNDPQSVPLIIDSHGGEVIDSNGNHIPEGVHLRPFRKGSWYANYFDHAHRIIQ